MSNISTQFKKGHKGYKGMLGKKLTPEHKAIALKNMRPGWNKGMKGLIGKGWGRKRKIALSHPVKSTEYYKENYKDNKAKLSEESRLRQLKKKLKEFNILEADYEMLLLLGCSVCKNLGTKEKRLHLDHSHKTGKFRGILCSNCNFAIGHSKDNPILLRRLANYLEGGVL